MASRWGKSGNSGRFYFPVLQNHCGWWLQPWNYKKLAPWKKSYDKPTKHIKKQRLYFDNKNPSCQRYDFSSSHVWMGDLGYKEGWASKNWCFQMVVLEKTLESPYHYELLFNILGFSLYGIMQHVFFGILFLLFDVRYLRSFDFFFSVGVLFYC